MNTLTQPASIDEGELVANPGSKLDMTRRDFVKTVSIGIGALANRSGWSRHHRTDWLWWQPGRSARSEGRLLADCQAGLHHGAAAGVSGGAQLSRSGSCIRAMSLSTPSTSTARGRWAVRCNTSCARTLRRITPGRPMRRGCCTTSQSPTFISPTRSRRRSRSTSAGARPTAPRRMVSLLPIRRS